MTEVVAEAGGADAAAAAAAAANVAQPVAPVAWTDSIQDAELKEWSVNKGYNKFELPLAAATIAQQYRSLEKLVGAEKAGRTVEIPDFANPDAAGAFFDRIGRPTDPTKYDLALPGADSGKNVDPGFVSWAQQNFHKAGLNGAQATTIGKAFMEYSDAAAAAKLAADKTRHEGEDKALKTKWGAAYDNKMALASAAAKQFGVPGEALVALQQAAGYGAAIEAFANIASKIGEDQFVTGESDTGGGKMTPEEAKAALAAHKADKDWMAAWMDKKHPKHKETLARAAYLAEMQVAVSA